MCMGPRLGNQLPQCCVVRRTTRCPDREPIHFHTKPLEVRNRRGWGAKGKTGGRLWSQTQDSVQRICSTSKLFFRTMLYFGNEGGIFQVLKNSHLSLLNSECCFFLQFIFMEKRAGLEVRKGKCLTDQLVQGADSNLIDPSSFCFIFHFLPFIAFHSASGKNVYYYVFHI